MKYIGIGKRTRILNLILGFAFLIPICSRAELNDCSQINTNGNVDAPGGCIAKTLRDQIGAGQGDEFTPGSSAYLIKRDPARSIRRGRQLFQRKFSRSEGHGPRINADSTGDITRHVNWVPVLPTVAVPVTVARKDPRAMAVMLRHDPTAVTHLTYLVSVW